MSFIKDLIDEQEKKKEQALKEQLEFLLTAARAKLQVYETALDNMFLNPAAQGAIQIVGERAMATFKEYQANVQENSDKQVGKVIDNFFSGNIKEGFKEVVKIGMNQILGNAQIGEQEFDDFFVTSEHNAIIRVDVKCWRYNFSSTGIIGNVQNAFCYVFCKSVVDHTKVSVDEYLYLLSAQLGDNLNKVESYLNELRSAWRAIDGTKPEVVQASYMRRQQNQKNVPVREPELVAVF